MPKRKKKHKAERKLNMDEYHYLTGYLSFAYDNDNLNDGAWMQMMVDGIDMLKEDATTDDPDFKGWDSHDIVMDFLICKQKERESEKNGNTKT